MHHDWRHAARSQIALRSRADGTDQASCYPALRHTVRSQAGVDRLSLVPSLGPRTIRIRTICILSERSANACRCLDDSGRHKVRQDWLGVLQP